MKDPEPEQVSAPCPGCGTAVLFEPVFKLGNLMIAPLCPACMNQENLKAQERAQGVRLDDRWKKLCPEQFRDTEFGRLPCPEKSQRAIEAKLDDGRGLNLWGLPRTGKTRTMYLILRTAHNNGKSMAIFSPNKFVAELEARAYHRAVWINNLAKLDLVAFDDMDKLCLTVPMEKMFFGLLDQRMRNKRPCLFTHNSGAEDLQFKFKMGDALVRRIRDFTKSIHFP